jgi:hypothetical protein
MTQISNEIERINCGYKLRSITSGRLRQRQIRAAAIGKSVSEIEAELEEMANDPDILRELAAIELEFAATSMDGLKG